MIPDPLTLAISKAGGLSAFARKLGLSPNTVHGWALVPRSRLAQVSRVTRTAQRVFRPDLARKAA